MRRIAAVQTNSSDNITENLETITPYVQQAVDQGAEVIVLPECFGFMQKSRQQLLAVAETEGQGLIQDSVAELSQKYGVWIIAGSVPLKSSDPDKVTNTLIVTNNQGQQVDSYSKIFLFDIELSSGESYRESSYTLAGDRSVVVDTPLGKIGLSICYDLRFPELYRKLAACGAELLVVPSAFSATTGKDHWMPLLRARAIENMCYVIAPAQYGIHNQKRKTWGHTVIIDPWGQVLSELESGWGLIMAEIDMGKLESFRRQLPCLNHIREDLF